MGNTFLRLQDYTSSGPHPKRWRHPDCSHEHLCGRIPCEVCGHAFQAWHTEQLKNHFGHIPDLNFVTMVHAGLLRTDEQFQFLDMRNCARIYRDTVQRAGLGHLRMMGALDYSRNSVVGKVTEGLWCTHVGVLLPSITKRQKADLLDCLPPSRHIERPLVVEEVYDLKGLLDYCAKPNFTRKTKYEDGPPGLSPLTRPLDGRHLQHLRSVLSKFDHADRIVAIGLKRMGNTMSVIKCSA